MTDVQKKALLILKETNFEKGMSAAGFAKKMWPDSNMHTSSKNTGHGSCTGKAAWLCGGSYLAKLRKLGYVNSVWDISGYNNGYCITQKGRDLINPPKT